MMVVMVLLEQMTTAAAPPQLVVPDAAAAAAIAAAALAGAGRQRSTAGVSLPSANFNARGPPAAPPARRWKAAAIGRFPYCGCDGGDRGKWGDSNDSAAPRVAMHHATTSVATAIAV